MATFLHIFSNVGIFVLAFPFSFYLLSLSFSYKLSPDAFEIVQWDHLEKWKIDEKCPVGGGKILAACSMKSNWAAILPRRNVFPNAAQWPGCLQIRLKIIILFTHSAKRRA
jgi:hypothetical protein